VNYDLPWNPNRLEQRFGRIHRIGQTEVCHLWNLVAHETREGEVFRTLFEKLEQSREALGGRVFDILGEVFEDKPLKDLLIEAIRYGDSPEVRARRRLAQAGETLDGATVESVAAEIAERDRIDSTRAVAPLKPAPDAVLVNTDALTAEQVADLVAAAVRKKQETAAPLRA
jgi:cytidylate kinase